jgi:hypothetical protein
MTEKIRVLYAEDSLIDADLTSTHFQLSAPHIEVDVVDTGEKCLARLDEKSTTSCSWTITCRTWMRSTF